MDLMNAGIENKTWIYVVSDCALWQDLIWAILNFRVPLSAVGELLPVT
jgi:hypothetical protein